ncbi:MAG: FAD-binding protein [Thiolinea sp.]
MSVAAHDFVRHMPAMARYDVVVLGAGAAGMAAAVFAALNGSKTLLLESTEYVGAPRPCPGHHLGTADPLSG